MIATLIKHTIDKMWVSTVFLGLEMAFRDGPPVLFETMIFGGPFDEQFQWRYHTKKEAIELPCLTLMYTPV